MTTGWEALRKLRSAAQSPRGTTGKPVSRELLDDQAALVAEILDPVFIARQV